MTKIEMVKTLNVKDCRAMLLSERRYFYQAAMDLIVKNIVRGIESRTAIVGGPHPALSPEWIAEKGHNHPLVWKNLLRNENTYNQDNLWKRNTAEITIKPIKSSDKKDTLPRNKVAYLLQVEGIGNKKWRFFGVSKDASKDIDVLLDEYIQKALEKL